MPIIATHCLQQVRQKCLLNPVRVLLVVGYGRDAEQQAIRHFSSQPIAECRQLLLEPTARQDSYRVQQTFLADLLQAMRSDDRHWLVGQMRL